MASNNLRLHQLGHSAVQNYKSLKYNFATKARRHYDDVRKRMKELGLSDVAMMRMESRYLPHVIAPHEQLGGIVYGKHKDGFAMIAATDKRIIFLDKKPFFSNEEEISYSVVSGVSIGNVGFMSTVTLNTRIKDYTIRTFNFKCAQNFVHFIEQRSIEYQQEYSDSL